MRYYTHVHMASYYCIWPFLLLLRDAHCPILRLWALVSTRLRGPQKLQTTATQHSLPVDRLHLRPEARHARYVQDRQPPGQTTPGVLASLPTEPRRQRGDLLNPALKRQLGW